jgi:hypothetical protein
MPVDVPSRFSSVFKSSNVVDLHNLKLNMKNITHHHHQHTTHSSQNMLEKKLLMLKAAITTTQAASTSSTSTSTTTYYQTTSSEFMSIGESSSTATTATTLTQHKFKHTRLPNNLITNIDNCVVSNESELKFKLESNLNEYNRLVNSRVKHVFNMGNASSSSSANNNKYQYEIEILVPDPNLKATIRTLASYYTNLTKFRMGVENGIQVEIYLEYQDY